jgi:chorismate-pyruvate lyase
MIASKWYSQPDDKRIVDERIHWLLQANRMVQAFKMNIGAVTMHTVVEAEALPFNEECDKLEISKPAHIRQVVIADAHHKPWCYARVVIPIDTYKAYLQQFAGLWTQFIGDTLLYNNPEVKRSSFEYACLSDESLYAEAYREITRQPHELFKKWPGRRSIFMWQDKPLLITEFLLPYLAQIPYTMNHITNGESL